MQRQRLSVLFCLLGLVGCSVDSAVGLPENGLRTPSK